MERGDYDNPGWFVSTQGESVRATLKSSTDMENSMTMRETSNRRSETEAMTDAAVDTARKAAEAAAEAVEDTPSERVVAAAGEAIEVIVSGQTEATRALESMRQTVLDGATRMQQELVDFVSTRVREDMEIQKELLRCRNFDDLREVQTKFFHTAVEQYAAELKRLLELSSEVVQRSVIGAA